MLMKHLFGGIAGLLLMPIVAGAQILVAGEGPVVYGHHHLNEPEMVDAHALVSPFLACLPLASVAGARASFFSASFARRKASSGVWTTCDASRSSATSGGWATSGPWS